jgi:hypothetical protein
MKKLILVVLSYLIIGCGALVDEQEAVSTLQDEGYTAINVIEAHYLAPSVYGCAKGDDVAFECSATSSTGKKVAVTVCSSFMFKGSTIRH